LFLCNYAVTFVRQGWIPVSDLVHSPFIVITSPYIFHLYMQ
jgi:hypothetical protein